MRIAPVGHSATHLPHVLQMSGLMYDRLSFTATAPNGQALTHFEQPIQAALQVLHAMAPRSRLEHATQTRLLRRPIGRSSIKCLTLVDACSASGALVGVDYGKFGVGVNSYGTEFTNRHAVATTEASVGASASADTCCIHYGACPGSVVDICFLTGFAVAVAAYNCNPFFGGFGCYSENRRNCFNVFFSGYRAV